MSKKQMMSLREAFQSGDLQKLIEGMETDLRKKRAVEPLRRLPPSPPSSPRFIPGFHPSQLTFSEDWDSGQTVASLAPPWAECPVCYSSGTEVFTEEGYKYARPCPVCGPARTIIDRFARLKISPEWAGISEDSTDWRPEHRALYENFTANWQPKDPGLFLYGKTGRGKSHLMALMAYAFAFRNLRVEWKRWGLFLEELRDSYGDASYNRDRESDFRKRIVHPDILFIDDFGEGRKTQWTEEIFERIIGHRLERRLTTIITSNIELHELEEYAGKRAYSRIRRVCIPIEIQGEDYRLRGL